MILAVSFAGAHSRTSALRFCHTGDEESWEASVSLFFW
jgi:hypothetical protein